MTRPIAPIALSVAEAARAVGVSEDIIRAHIRTGRLYAIPFGRDPGKGDLRIGVAELERVFSRPEVRP